MEKLKHFILIFDRKTSFLILIVICSLLLGCNNDSDIPQMFTVTGNVFCIGADTNGVKVSLQNTDDPSLKYVAVTDQAGNFEFQDIAGGRYSIDASKDGLVYGWYKDGDYTNQRDGIINIFENKDLVICVQRTSSIRDFELDITDMSGKPIGNSIPISRQTTTVAFRLYNKTTRSQYWSVYLDHGCIVSGFVSYEIGFKTERIFSSFSATSGTVRPGDAMVVVGTINPAIFEFSKPEPHYLLQTLTFRSTYGSKDIYLNIDFGK